MRRVSALTLLMLRVFTNDHDFALALNDLALFAHGLDGRSYLHWDYLLLGLSRSNHFARHVILPFVRSQGDISTVTWSPGTMRI